jgi:hypothetical protein
MKIQLTATKTIAEVQEEFNRVYPYLRLEFFSQPHQAYKGSPAESKITDRHLTIGHLRQVDHNGAVYIEPDMLVLQVERLFENEFGLHVQVVRKSGAKWLATSMTDDLTLEDQNTRGKAFDTVQVQPDEPMDYREQD